MNNTLALTKIIDIFYSLAMGNKMVNDYFFGTSYNINSANERRYPLIAVEPTNSTVTSSGNGGASRMNVYLHSFNVYSLDRIAKGDGNFNELLNDCQFILQTFITQIDQHPYYTDLGMMFDGDVNLQPVFEVEDDNVNGWMATITIKVPNKYTPCNTPQIPILSWTTSYANGTNQLRLVGPPGPTGPAATIQVGSVSTSGSVPTITNVGTSFSAIFDFTFPASSGGGGNLQQTLTLGNTASLGFQLYEGSLIDLNDNFGNTNTLGAANITIADSLGNQLILNNQGLIVGNTSSEVTIQNSNIIKTDTITGAETILEFNQTSASRTIIFPDNSGTIALLTDITGGDLQTTLTLGNTASINIELQNAAFQSLGSGGDSATLGSGGLQLIDGLNQGVVTPFSIKVESPTSYLESDDTKIRKVDPSDGRYTDLIFDQTTAGQVNTITIPDNTGTVALLSDIPAPIPGEAATIEIGTVISGTISSVINVGTSQSAIFDFIIEKGVDGINGTNGTNGLNGEAATIEIGTVITGSTSSVTNVGTSQSAIFNFILEKGADGTNGVDGINGATGADGLAATIQVGTVSVSGSIPTVTNVGTSQSAIFDFTFPASGSGGGSSATGSINSIQYNNSGSLGGAENVFIINGNINIVSATATPATQSNSISLYNSGNTQSFDSRLSSTDQWGRTTQYGTYEGNKIISRLIPGVSSGLNFTCYGNWSPTVIQAIGAVTFPNRYYDATNLAPNFVRIRCAATTAANNTAGIRWGVQFRTGIQWEPSNSGGFLQFTFTTPTWNSGQRLFIGYQSLVVAPTSTNRIDSFVDMVGLGKDADDTNLQWMINDATGTATRVDTGIVPSVNNVYRSSVFINSDCSIIKLSLEEITRTSSNIVSTHTFVRGVDDMPALGQQSYPMVYVNSAATSTAVTVDIINGYEELLTL